MQEELDVNVSNVEIIDTKGMPNSQGAPSKHNIDLTQDEEPTKYNSTVRLIVDEFGSDRLDSAIIDIVLTPIIPDTFNRSFVIRYYKNKEGTYALIPIRDSTRKASIRINALGYKGNMISKDLIAGDTIIVARELWPMYPDSAQLVIKENYKKWMKKENDKIMDRTNLEQQDKAYFGN